MTAWSGPLPDEHADCGQQYVCVGCGKQICPRCDVSPTEADELCRECWWIADPGGVVA